MFAGFGIFLLCLAALALTLKLAFPLPSRDGWEPDLPRPSAQSELAERIAPLTAGHPGQSGLILLPTGIKAFAMRLAMVRNASQTLDAQYYIWEGDLSGRMLLQEIIAAADRGVRVRLLIDDNPTAGLDPMWAAIDSHPQIEVRIFNPLTIRAIRPLNYLFDFPRLNRRMHNKSLTVDGVATLVGGRNIGDVYFGAANENLFIDLDTVAVGAVVPDVTRQFDEYWDSLSSYPAATVLSKAAPDAIASYREPDFEDAALAADYRNAAQEAEQTLGLDRPEETLSWASMELFYDNPAKGLGEVPEDDLLAAHIVPLISGSEERFDLVSGYFVPVDFGTELLTDLAEKGVRTRVVTNSIQVTDVAVVHAGYAPSRKPLLRSGVELYEARPRDDDREFKASQLGSVRFSGGGESVHAKTFAIDSRHLFIGSFNFDPRSALLNCEMGLMIDSPELTKLLVEELDSRLPEASYSLALNDSNDITWTSRDDGEKRVETTEPGTTAFGRFLVGTISKLPIAWML